MKGEKQIRLGTLHKPWGNKGEVIVEMIAHGAEDFLPEGWFFVDVDAQLVPFRYLQIREANKQGVLIRFADYSSPEEAAFFNGKDLYAPEKTILNEKKSALVEDELIGVQVVDTTHGDLGNVIRIEGSRTQTVLVILKGVKEILIPLAEDLVEEYDPDSRLLTVSTPPGLIDMYLS